MKMTPTTVIVGTAIIAAAAFIAVPSLKGPINHLRNTANEKLDEKFLVDNYRSEVISLTAKRKSIVESIRKFSLEQKVAEKHLAVARATEAKAKQNVVDTGTSDMAAFNRAKDAYEYSMTEVANLSTEVNTYSQAVVRLQKSLSLCESNLRKANLNVKTLTTKKQLVNSIREVNDTVENLSGIGDDGIATNIEKLDDDYLRESLKLEALADTEVAIDDKASADAYIEAIKNIK